VGVHVFPVFLQVAIGIAKPLETTGYGPGHLYHFCWLLLANAVAPLLNSFGKGKDKFQGFPEENYK
jgi:hypothetical protein